MGDGEMGSNYVQSQKVRLYIHFVFGYKGFEPTEAE